MNIVTEFFAKHVNQIPSRGVPWRSQGGVVAHAKDYLIAPSKTFTKKKNLQRGSILFTCS